jgi:O-antigen/teichoic acid export membrane protein
MTLPDRSLRARLKGAAAWTALGHLTTQAIKLLSNLVMTYLLVPSDFGLMAIVGVLVMGITFLSDVGVSQALVAIPQGADRKFRNTVWTFQVVRGLGAWALSFVLALFFWIAGQRQWFPPDSVYSDERLPLVIVGTFAQLAIQGFQSTKLLMAQRNVSVKELMIQRNAAQLVALIPMFLIGWYYRSVWALVAGGATAMLVQVTLSHVLIKGEPDRFAWDRSVLNEVWRFGRWILLSSVVNFLAGTTDRILLGRLVDSTQLGLYAIAGLLVAPATSIFSMLVSTVVFPGISEVNRTRPHDLPAAYSRFQQYMDGLAGVGAGMLYMAGPALVHVLYRDAYAPAGAMLSVLALNLVGLRFYVVEQVYIAKGETHWMTAANVLRLASLVVFVPTGFHLNGMEGAVAGVACSYFASWPLAFYFRRKVGIGSWGADVALLPALAAGALFGHLLSLALAVAPRLQH